MPISRLDTKTCLGLFRPKTKGFAYVQFAYDSGRGRKNNLGHALFALATTKNKIWPPGIEPGTI